MFILIQINGVDGTIIANQYGEGANPQTVISFDNGARWNRIPSPVDVDGRPTSCTLVRLLVVVVVAIVVVFV